MKRITDVIDRALKGEIRIAELVADKHPPTSARAQDVPGRPGRDNRQRPVEPRDGDRGDRPRPARLALRPD